MTDTIAAIASGYTPAGIGIVRISGQEAVSIADALFYPSGTLSAAATHTMHYGHIKENGIVLDEVMAAVMRAPKTYTREDTVEIYCHGGPYVLRQVLEAVLRAGARLAEPGEFTKRAFLSGRVDLSQAEAVMDLIESGSSAAARNALLHIKGSLREEISGIRAKLLYETAFIESALDDPEHYTLDEAYEAHLLDVIGDCAAKIRHLLSTAEDGRIIKEGIATVILGRPNVGKSTLMNALLGQDRAIVTDIAGTTRDILEGSASFGGLPLRLIDTAGLREGGDVIEKIGMDRARAAAADADLVLLVLDAGEEIAPEDASVFAAAANRPCIAVLNKADLPDAADTEEIKEKLRELGVDAPVIAISALHRTGIDELTGYIKDLFFSGTLTPGEEAYITNIRQKEALSDAEKSLALVKDSVESGMPEDLLLVDLMDAYAALGRIIGEEVSDDLVNEIFSRFCMGK